MSDPASVLLFVLPAEPGCEARVEFVLSDKTVCIQDTCSPRRGALVLPVLMFRAMLDADTGGPEPFSAMVANEDGGFGGPLYLTRRLLARAYMGERGGYVQLMRTGPADFFDFTAYEWDCLFGSEERMAEALAIVRRGEPGALSVPPVATR